MTFEQVKQSMDWVSRMVLLFVCGWLAGKVTVPKTQQQIYYLVLPNNSMMICENWAQPDTCKFMPGEGKAK